MKDDNKIGLLTDLYTSLKTTVHNSTSVYLKALLAQINDCADQALNNLQIEDLHLLDPQRDRPNLDFLGLPAILESAQDILQDDHPHLPPRSSYRNRDRSIENKKAEKQKMISASVGRQKYQNTESDIDERDLFEEMLTPAQLKRRGELRLRGHVLCALSKNVAVTTRTAMIRWWVRTHKKFTKKVLTSFVIKSQIQTQVALWRFKWLAAPGKKKRKHYTKFMEEVAGFVEIVEHRQRARLVRNAFFKVRLTSECRRIKKNFMHAGDLAGYIDGNHSFFHYNNNTLIHSLLGCS